MIFRPLLIAALLCGCTEFIPGITMDVQVELGANLPDPLHTREGVLVEPSASFVGLVVEGLQPCEPQTASRSAPGRTFERVLDALSPISTAHAHTPNTGPQAGLIHIEDMRATRTPMLLGSLSPAPGRYCGVRVRISAPEGVQIAALFVEGHYSAANDAELHLFRLRNFDRMSRVLLFESPIELTDAQSVGEIRIRLAYQKWFDGLSLDRADEADVSSRALLNVLDTLGTHAEVY